MTDAETPRKTKDEKLVDLRERLAIREKAYDENLAKLKLKIEKLDAQETTQQRRDNTRRKILYGAMLEDRVKNRKLSESKLTEWMDNYLIRDDDRLFFGFNIIHKSTARSQSVEVNTIDESPDRSESVEVNVEKYNVTLLKLPIHVFDFKVSAILTKYLNKTLEEAQKIAEDAADSAVLICDNVDYSTATLLRLDLEEIDCEVEVDRIELG